MADAETTLGDLVTAGGRHFVGDLDPTSALVGPQRGLVLAPLTDSVRTIAGSAPVGVLATLFDVVASQPTLANVGQDWTATQNLSVHATDWLTDGPMVVDASLVRIGKKAVVVDAAIYDAHGLDDLLEVRDAIDDTGADSGRVTLAGRGLLTFARLPANAAVDGGVMRPSAVIGEVVRRSYLPADERQIEARIGLEVVDGAAGILQLERTPYVTNSIGTINGGTQCVMVEAAAEAMCPDLVATDIAVHFLSQLKVGPARSRGTVSRAGDEHAVVAVELVDHGADDQVLTLATVTLQRPPAR
jgi:acyl-coenzyme A thioesterase PaaI-like protein